jgi:hypothetical protein
MPKIKATDALRRLNLEFGCDLSYARFNKGIVSGQIPATRDTGGHQWVIDEDHLASIATRFGTASARRHRTAA